MNDMKTLRIGEYDVILQNLGEHQGKIIIASPYLNTSYYWGAMGSSLEEFICSIDSYYWLNKLLPINTPTVLNVRKTFSAFRKHLFKEALADYPWYGFKEFYKGLREAINSIQSHSEGPNDFIENVHGLPNSLSYFDIGDRYARTKIEECIQGACSEPWHFIIEGESREQRQLLWIHKELKKALKKSQVLTPTPDAP